MAGGPPAATVSRDVSLCPTWKQRPHSAYYSRWSAVAGLSRLTMHLESIQGGKFSFCQNTNQFPLFLESTRCSLENLKFAKPELSRFGLKANRFKKSGRLGLLEKLDVRPSSRILRQPSKLEPVPGKSDNVRSENPQPMDSQYG
ncbi:hypothetical protein PIB30_099315 [Stylosanthes scabra]|uniref:Uncharacterized protein n=1 Tax=Stylosanthes scabra TaxID=79078 RepID=A0ABU6RXK4_9FABA|nr:hypothetical protein [Stylosanthes scabra]